MSFNISALLSMLHNFISRLSSLKFKYRWGFNYGLQPAHKKKLASTLIVFYATTMLSAPPLPLVIAQRGDHYHFATYWSAENMVQLCSFQAFTQRHVRVIQPRQTDLRKNQPRSLPARFPG